MLLRPNFLTAIYRAQSAGLKCLNWDLDVNPCAPPCLLPGSGAVRVGVIQPICLSGGRALTLGAHQAPAPVGRPGCKAQDASSGRANHHQSLVGQHTLTLLLYSKMQWLRASYW